MRLIPRAGLASLVLFAAAFTTPPHAEPMGPTSPPPPRPAADLAEPLRLLHEARTAWAHVEDYTCILVRRERVAGQPGAEEVMLMKARREPFSVYLRWAAPPSAVKQEACYVAGRSAGQPPAPSHSSRPIAETGIGPLIERLGHEWTAGHSGVSRVRVSDAEFDGRPCRRVELSGEGRVVVHFDRETHLPIRAEWYDGDELREASAYTKVRLNVGLAGADFAY
jgi:hypothetical protein